MTKKINIAIANNGLGVGFYVPKNIVKNSEIARIFTGFGVTTKHGEPLTARWMAEHVGLDQRRYSDPDDLSSHLAVKAAQQALNAAMVLPQQLGVIRVASSTPDCLYPPLSCLVQKDLIDQDFSLSRLDAFDISSACTGGLHAMICVKQALLDDCDTDHGLAIGAETMSKIIDFTDANAQVWGDGAGAVVLEKTTDDRGIICSKFMSIPEAHDKTESVGLGTRYFGKNITPNAWFIGTEVQRFVLKAIEEIIGLTLEKANKIMLAENKQTIELADIKMFATHQANARIFERPARNLGIPLDKFYVNFPKYGNTSSASVLICLAEMIQKGIVKTGDLVMLIAFGGGLTYGAVLLRI